MSLVFRNFYFDYYTYRFGLGFRLGFGWVRARIRVKVELGLVFFRLYFKMSVQMEHSPSLFLIDYSSLNDRKCLLHRPGFEHQIAAAPAAN